MIDRIIALLKTRIAFHAEEMARNSKSHYAELAKWRKLEAEYLLERIRQIESETKQ